MHRPLDPNTGKPLPIVKEPPSKGSRPPTLAKAKPAKEPEKSTPKPKVAKTTKEEK